MCVIIFLYSKDRSGIMESLADKMLEIKSVSKSFANKKTIYKILVKIYI